MGFGEERGGGGKEESRRGAKVKEAAVKREGVDGKGNDKKVFKKKKRGEGGS